MKVLYRISEGGNKKDKLHFVYNKEKMFLHFIKVFKNDDIYVFADNVSDKFYSFLKEHYDINKIFRITLGNSKSFMCALNIAINEFCDDEIIYFAEDDYIYKPDASKIIQEGLQIGEYSSGYDHPDKYIDYDKGGPNPFIRNGGETTIVKITQSTHWKITNSCCMTFASKVKTLKEDYHIFSKFCENSIPLDFQIFTELKNKNHNVVSCIPAVSTHGETQWLSPFINWENEYNK